MRAKGNSLVGVLVAALIVIGLAVAFAVGSGALGGAGLPERADGKGETIIGRSMARADDTACRSNLSQVRQAIEIGTDPVEGGRPDSLRSLRLPAEFLKCAVGDEPYEYDAASGVVRCVHPGHEKY